MFRKQPMPVARTLWLIGSICAAVAIALPGFAQTSPELRMQRRSGAVPLGEPMPQLQQLIAFETSVSPRSPVAALVSWRDTGGAPGYDILRDGQMIQAVGGDARAYVDGSLRPNTKYTYQVRTRTAAPTSNWHPTLDPITGKYTKPAFTPVDGTAASSVPPRVTAAVEFVTPRALAPTSVSVAIRPYGVNRITWTPRPETQWYVITRNGAGVRVAATGSPAVFDDSELRAGTYTYTIHSLVRTADGVEVPGEPSQPLAVVTRPFNIVAIGDSVMWGQGLAEGSKFVTKVKQQLASRLGGRTVRLFLFARSGAELGAAPYPTQFPLAAEAQAVQELAAFSGEIPRSLPSIMHQGLTLAPAQIPPGDVDLVLMDGCINDVTVATILNPTITEADLGNRTRDFCGPKTMDERLARVHSTFPNARILLTGYFPIISSQSDLTAVAILMMNVGALSVAAAPLVGVPVDPATGAIAGAVTSEVLRGKAVGSSALFHATSNSALQVSAVGSNQRLGGNRIRFVPIPFGPQNAYAAPQTWLWLVPTPGVPLPNAKDEVFDQRVQACRSVPNMPASCIPASMGHPNVQGAQAYADAIMNTLGEFVPAWQMQFASVRSL
jgi:lysophospholipase L1-like esterase